MGLYSVSMSGSVSCRFAVDRLVVDVKGYVKSARRTYVVGRTEEKNWERSLIRQVDSEDSEEG